MKRYLLFWCSMISISLYAQKKPWSWLYQQVFSPEDQVGYVKKNVLLFSKTDVPLFTQLLFSWNVLRPKQGYYSFYVQVHSKKKNVWGAWHKMADWGKDIQKSYESPSDGISKFVYVRLEVAAGDKADGFRIKIRAHNTDVSAIKALTVNISDFNKFTLERVQKGAYGSVVISGVPQKSQLMIEHENKRMMCSPTSCSMLHAYLTQKQSDPLTFAEQSYDYGLLAYGSWPFNMAHAFDAAGGDCLFYTTRLHSFKSLHDRLKQDIPVAVSVRGEIIGAPKEYNNGHLLLVIGYDAQKHMIIVHDPAAATDEETVKEYPVDSFIKAWDRSRRLSYIAIPKRVQKGGGMR